ncbi:YaaL family protein [Clostridium sp. AN503]|uniref:YaaL family protein n=1 Tax=Clostridium sp. AN503 TaxID=3160598 RepID=UPI003457942B
MAGHFFKKEREKRPSLENLELKAEIEQTRHKMESARNQFEQVVDPTLIDCYIYELNAAQLRYQFLLRRVKILEGLY